MSLTIQSRQGNYPVTFHSTIDTALENLFHFLGKAPHALLLVDRNVSQLYRQELNTTIGRYPHFFIDANEEQKTWEGVGRVLHWLQDNEATKQTQLIAIGGGIVQDIATFAAHVYYRGIGWHFLPTTLLSMSDSSIGAKCGINLGRFKNQLGLFQAPRSIHISTQFLETLEGSDLLSGLGEVIKLSLTGPDPFFDQLESQVTRTPLRELPFLELIEDSLKVKKAVIEQDEYETDLRRVLNYGHTFGHALETITHHSIPHGAAVAWGIDLINYLSYRRGILAEHVFKRIHNFLTTYFTWSHFSAPSATAISSDALITAARRDKKVADGHVNLAMLAGIGELRIVKTPFDLRLSQEIGDYLAQHNALSWN